MNEKRSYKCGKCGGEKNVNSLDESVPLCCGDTMELDVPVCTVSETAEHARFDEMDEPCDDGRSGKI